MHIFTVSIPYAIRIGKCSGLLLKQGWCMVSVQGVKSFSSGIFWGLKIKKRLKTAGLLFIIEKEMR
ncbi:hypothetical protein DXA38_15550 [[Clostridium] innocuum]|uniref:Uncharacterized protein n=1 Tax=Clostridium innocuum TaxID=1522 RepID=A0A3E2VT00_CLOIN|nr:hypothetical protein DXA38_15550 [[Clostridium] innocuum]RHV60549.1 hypothetical protein DXB22_18390 [Clostridiaceae bacterium OM02-2AC]